VGREYNQSKEVEVMIYRIALRASEEGYSVSVPGLPGCWSQGATETEALENIREAIREYLAVAVELTQDAEIREVDVAV
jgi:predicted RNase H-like HicB family nuclease